MQFRETYVGDFGGEQLNWSGWLAFSEVLDHAPRLPGVYRARQGVDGPIVYIGMAGERNGSNGRPQGLRGRLSVYTSGKGLASGLGEAVFDRALANEAWLAERMAEVSSGRSRRAKSWGVQAFIWADLYLSWVTTADKAAALSLERTIIESADHSMLWNRDGVHPARRSKASTLPPTFGASIDAQTAQPRQSEVHASVEASSDGTTTQRVTKTDLQSGQIRIPGRNKWAFPSEPCALEVVIRGQTTICRWNPNGQRSGVLRPPSSLLRELVPEDVRLLIDTDSVPMGLS